jgi:hypothetical protein
MLIYDCPTTAKLVCTSIETSGTELKRLRELKISLPALPNRSRRFGQGYSAGVGWRGHWLKRSELT